MRSASPPAAEAEVGAALAEAEARCVAAGQRWTAPRRRVFELVVRAAAPVKAYDLLDALSRDGSPAFPPTVYRALAALEALGLVHRIGGLNAFVACADTGHAHAPAFLVCDRCGAVQEFDGPLASVGDAARAEGFSARAVSLEVRGLCRACGGAP